MHGFEVHVEGDARVVVSGELDMATAPQLASVVEGVGSTTARRVVVDLTAVSFMDSSGISTLCRSRADLEERGVVLVLGATSAAVESSLRMVGLEAEFVRE